MKRADVTCRIRLLQAAVGRPVVSCRFPSRPIMLHVQAVVHRVKKLRKKASFKHTCAYPSRYASACRPSAVVWHPRHGGYVIRLLEGRNFLIGQAAEPSGGLPQEASPRDAMHTPSIHEVHHRWQMPMLSSGPGLSLMDHTRCRCPVERAPGWGSSRR